MKIPALALTLALALACPALAQDPAAKALADPGSAIDAGEQGQFRINTKRATATIDSIDLKAMTSQVTLQNGKQITVKLDKRAKNLDQVKPGDSVDLEITASLLLTLKRDQGEPQAYTLKDEEFTVTKKGKPARYIVETRVASAVVKAIDKKKRRITLEGADGKVSEFKVGKDVKGFKDVRVGDRIIAKYTESTAVRVIPRKK